MEQNKKGCKWIIVRRDHLIISALWQNYKIEELHVCEAENTVVGNIYVGRVRNIVSNIHAAFVEYQKDAFGYLDLRNCPPGTKVTEGQTLLVQVQRDAIKTKEPVLSMNLQMAGRYCIALHDESGINISTKIRDEAWRRQVKEYFAEGDALIVRTKAYELESLDLLKEEYDILQNQLQEIGRIGAARNAFSVLYQAIPEYCSYVRDSNLDLVEEVVTDDEAIAEELKRTLSGISDAYRAKVKLQTPNQGDYLSLEGKFGIHKLLEELTRRIVYLPSGAYLVIDYTEAMTVIDVNSGKAIGKKKPEGDETFLKIDLEAAVEIARQLRLRNLSGMILVDFIDLKAEESNRKLMNTLHAEVARDPIKTTVVDMTKLGIVELTRKRTTRPLHEIYGKDRG